MTRTRDLPTREERIDALLGRSDETSGERFVASPAFRALDLSAGRRQTALVDVRSAQETVDAIRTRATLAVDPMRSRQVGNVQTEPRPAGLLDGLTVVPFTPDNASSIVKREESDATEDAAGHDAGTDPDTASAYGLTSITFASTDDRPVKIVTSAEVDEDALRDDDATRFVVQEVVDGVLLQEVERQALVGTGTATELDGILNASARAQVTRDTAGGETRYAAIRRGVTALHNAGHRGALALVTNGDDAEALDLETDADGNYTSALLDRVISRRIVTPALTTGTVVVAALGASVLWLGSIGVQVTDAHADYFTSGWLAMRAQVKGSLQVQDSAVAEVSIA